MHPQGGDEKELRRRGCATRFLRMKFVPLVCIAAAAGCGWIRAGILDDLSKADQARVKGGRQVVAAEPLEGYPWPRVRVYQKVNAKPEELMAVFFDYEKSKDFVPNCEKSKISKKINPRTFEVDYLVNVPIFADEAYTVRNVLSTSRNPLKVEWKVLRATSILESEGSLLVEPHGDGAVLCYTNLVKPSSAAADLLKGVALGQMKDTVKAIVAQVEKMKTENPDLLAKQLERLESALAN